MPSKQILKQKQEYVADLTEKMKKSCAGVLVDYKGISVEQDTKMRRELRAAGVDYFVVKNTMLRFASKQAGFDFEQHLQGTTALALSEEDPIAAAKVLSKYAKELKDSTSFSIKAGFMDGQEMDSAKVVELGNLPSKEQLVGQLLSVLVAPIRGLAVALNAIAEKSGDESQEQAAE